MGLQLDKIKIGIVIIYRARVGEFSEFDQENVREIYPNDSRVNGFSYVHRLERLDYSDWTSEIER